MQMLGSSPLLSAKFTGLPAARVRVHPPRDAYGVWAQEDPELGIVVSGMEVFGRDVRARALGSRLVEGGLPGDHDQWTSIRGRIAL